MKILILHSSGRKTGTTGAILDLFESAIGPEHETERINLNRLAIRPCTGCLGCRPDKTCVLPEDDGHRLAEKIAVADVLVTATPTYYGNMSGDMKTLFDRILPVLEYLPMGKMALPKRNQKGKTAFIITASNSPWPFNQLPSQSRGTIQSVKTVLKCGGYGIKGIINVPMAFRGNLSRSVQKKAVRMGKRI